MPLESELQEGALRDYFAAVKRDAHPEWKILITGPSGVGKTTLLYRLLAASGERFDEIFVKCNTHNQIVYNATTLVYNRFTHTASQSQDQQATKKGVSSEARLAALCKNTGHEPTKKYKVLYIMDDVSARIYKNGCFEDLTHSARHRRIYLIILVHELKKISSSMRAEFDNFVLSYNRTFLPNLMRFNESAVSLCNRIRQVRATPKAKFASNWILLCSRVYGSRLFYSLAFDLSPLRSISAEMFLTKRAIIYHRTHMSTVPLLGELLGPSEEPTIDTELGGQGVNEMAASSGHVDRQDAIGSADAPIPSNGPTSVNNGQELITPASAYRHVDRQDAIGSADGPTSVPNGPTSVPNGPTSVPNGPTSVNNGELITPTSVYGQAMDSVGVSLTGPVHGQAIVHGSIEIGDHDTENAHVQTLVNSTGSVSGRGASGGQLLVGTEQELAAANAMAAADVMKEVVMGSMAEVNDLARREGLLAANGLLAIRGFAAALGCTANLGNADRIKTSPQETEAVPVNDATMGDVATVAISTDDGYAEETPDVPEANEMDTSSQVHGDEASTELADNAAGQEQESPHGMTNSDTQPPNAVELVDQAEADKVVEDGQTNDDAGEAKATGETDEAGETGGALTPTAVTAEDDECDIEPTAAQGVKRKQRRKSVIAPRKRRR